MKNRNRLDFDEAGRLPAPGDNAAIATRRLEAGTRVALEETEVRIRHTVLEGHRFAVRPVAVGEELFSWGLPFGTATRRIEPGDYIRNAKILTTLHERHVDFEIPTEANFEDAEHRPYTLDEAAFRPGEQVAPAGDSLTFEGYERDGGRGTGTRNYVVVLGLTSRTGSFAKVLEERLKSATEPFESVSGVIAVAHTEGGEERTPNNLELLLRTLAGFVIHPNVGAVLVVDEGEGPVTNRMLREYMEEKGYPLSDVPHRFMSLKGGFGAALREGEEVVRGWLPEVDQARRVKRPLSELKVALQCGGSDAFSGVSANPLVAWVAREVIRHGGAANLAETDELIGAEEYVLKNARDLATARSFLDKVERFKERVGWHGHTAEGNPSGGNNYRGLYNITIKSIGAAAKRHPDVRLDHVIEYAEHMREPGFHFMDSPGNDLESIAGQVASGSSLIFFTTGNGSITNFPFVPTIKVVTTTGRYELLESDMDVNAGAYLDGVPMDDLGRETLDLTLRAASGERTVGERAGHSQVSIWRDWKQTDTGHLEVLLKATGPDGRPLPVRPGEPRDDLLFDAVKNSERLVADRVGLVMPTSLCSGQISLRIANLLNERGPGEGKLTRFVALPHTEGCGVSGGSSETLFSRTVVGHLAHPSVGVALLLEHGCEKTHNDYFHEQLAERGLDPDRFGWASVQLDGGIEKVVRKAGDWFAETLEGMEDLRTEPAGLDRINLALHAAGPLPDDAAGSMAEVARTVVATGGTVIVPEKSSLLSSEAFVRETLEGELWVTLAYGQAVRETGFHVMESPTDNWLETTTGLGATGAQTMLAHVAGRPLQSHRMVPLLQVSSDPATVADHGEDLDAALNGDPNNWTEELLCVVLDVASRRYTPKLFGVGNTGFQLTRGLLGVSM
jgi:altronate dehydratase